MTDHATSAAAYAEANASGKIESVRKQVHWKFREFGPMADWQLYTRLPYDVRVLMTRRAELARDGIVGLMGYTNQNPETGNDCQVWGLIVEHGAQPYYPDDKIEVRVRGIRASSAE